MGADQRVWITSRAKRLQVDPLLGVLASICRKNNNFDQNHLDGFFMFLLKRHRTIPFYKGAYREAA